MDKMLDGKDHLFGTLHPFGMFNRFLPPEDGLYLESGFLKYQMGYFVPESYMPAKWQFLTKYTYYVGSVRLKLTYTDKTAGIYELKIPTPVEVLYNQKFNLANILESKALGCFPKTDTITMINPKGDEATCVYTFTPLREDPMYPNPSSLASLMDYVNATSIKALSPAVELSPNRYCKKPDRTQEEYKEEGNKIFCDNEIMDKKFCRVLYPPSVFSGKLRLYIQSIYGGTEIKYCTDKSASSMRNLYVGLYACQENLERAARVAVFGRGTHWLYTYKYHHFLIRSNGFAVNPLVPVTSQGHQLKKFLQGNPSTLTQDQIDNLEAYLLSVSSATRTVHPRGAASASAEVYKSGYPFDFGLNGNWNGDSAIMVTQTRTDDNYRKSSVVQVRTICSGLEQALEAELERQCESLATTFEIEQNRLPTPTGVYKRFVCTGVQVVVTPDPTPTDPDKKKTTIIGPIESGSWWYVLNAPKDSTEDQLKNLEDQLKDKNRQYGGLPYSEEFFSELESCFQFDVTVDTHGPWLEPLQQDKLFTWDPYYNDYYWNYPCNHRSIDEKCQKPVSGSFPVYAWYSRSGNQIIVNYNYRDVDDRDNDVQPGEGLCGPGTDKYFESKRNGGSESGFSVNDIKATVISSPSYTRSNTSISISGGSWLAGSGQQVWAAQCGVTFCDGNTCPEGGKIGGFFSHWSSTRYGTGTYKGTRSSGGGYHYTAALIPKDDCQAVHIAGMTIETETEEKSDATFENCPNAAKCSGITYIGTPKIVGEQAQGWLTCVGLYFAKVFKSNTDNIELWATGNWCIFYPHGGEVGHFKCNFRKWGPDGPEDITVGLIAAQLGNVTSSEYTKQVKINESIVGKYIKPNGSGVTMVEESGSATGSESDDWYDIESKIKIKRLYAALLTNIDVRWPYAGCGAAYNSITTTNKNGDLCQIQGGSISTVPEKWPFDKGFVHPVGYI